MYVKPVHYYIGRGELVEKGVLSAEDANKWAVIDDKLASLHGNTKELLWYSGRRISREYASSEEGLGKYPKGKKGDD